MSFKINPDNIFKSTVGKKEKLTLEDIAKCTGGGGGIGATISRNLSRLKTLSKGEGWITGNKVTSLLNTAEKTDLINIKNNFDGKLNQIKNKLSKGNLNKLTPLKNESKKIEQISKVLNSELPDIMTLADEAEKVTFALKSLSYLKKLDPLLILAAPSEFGIDSKLSKDFTNYLRMRNPLPSSNKELKTAYKEFLQAQFSSIDSSKSLDDNKLKKLESYANKKVIDDIYMLNETLGPKIYPNELIPKSLGLKTQFTTETFYNDVQGEALLDNTKLSEQLQKDSMRNMQDHIHINNEHQNITKNTNVDESKSYADFVPKTLKEFAGNDDGKIRMIAILLTQGATGSSTEYMKKYAITTPDELGRRVSTGDEVINSLSTRYDFDFVNGQRQVRITSDFVQKFTDGETPSKNFVVTNYINLDDPHAPVYMTEG